MHKLCINYARIMHKLYTNYVQIMHKLYTNYTQIPEVHTRRINFNLLINSLTSNNANLADRISGKSTGTPQHTMHSITQFKTNNALHWNICPRFNILTIKPKYNTAETIQIHCCLCKSNRDQAIILLVIRQLITFKKKSGVKNIRLKQAKL